MGTIHLDYCKLETIDQEFRHKLFCGFGNSNRLRLFLRFINIFFFVVVFLDDFVSSSFVVFSFLLVYSSPCLIRSLPSIRWTDVEWHFVLLREDDGCRRRSMKEPLHTRRSVLGMFIDSLLSPCLSHLSLSLCLCVCTFHFRPLSTTWEEMLWQTQLHRPCMLNWAPPFHRILFSHTHTTGHTQTVKVTCVWLLSFDRRE
jgi:hypothetical protein